MGLQFWSTALSTGSALAEGRFQQEVSRNNAALARFQAEDALRRGNLAEAESRRRTEQLKGTQQAALAANNVVLGEGSALDILQSTAELGELDAQTIRNNAEREAVGLGFQAETFLTQGRLARARGRTQAIAATIEGGKSVISTASQVPGGFGGG